MNKIAIAGRVVEKPVLYYNDQIDPNHEHPFTYVKIAADDRRGNTEFFTVSTVNGSATACVEYLDKGDIVSAEGAITIKQSLKDGKVYNSLFIKNGYVQFEKTSGKADTSETETEAIAEPVAVSELEADPLPF